MNAIMSRGADGDVGQRDRSFAAQLIALLDNCGSMIGWKITEGPVWAHATPGEVRLPPSGWKLHVSSSLPDAPAVLNAVAPLLIEAGCTFKVAGGSEDLVALLSGRCHRGQAGKFITAYPKACIDIDALADRLDRATAGYRGPRILSDAPHCPGSLVHWRYGAFRGEDQLGLDGLYRMVIRDPAGRPVEDKRTAAFTPPSWVPLPTRLAHTVRQQANSGPVVLANRYRIDCALRHANRGGVYRGTDQETRAVVIVKEARPYVLLGADLRDARDVLNAEADVTARLARVGLAPHVLARIVQDDHLFLVEELVPGSTLRAYISGATQTEGVATLCVRLVDLLAAVHAAGVAVGDFNPNNIIVRPDLTLTLIDLESAGDVTQPDGMPGGGTLSYTSRGQLEGGPASASGDLFSLGATLFYVLTRVDPPWPDLPADDPKCAPGVRAVLDAAATERCIPERVIQEVTALLSGDPRHRPSLSDVRTVMVARALTSSGLTATPAEVTRDSADARPTQSPEPLDDEVWRRVESIADHLIDLVFAPDPTAALVTVRGGARGHPANVFTGLAGPSAALLAFHRIQPEHPRLEVALHRCAQLICAAVKSAPLQLPGLFFGAAGPAWVLTDLGQRLNDPGLIRAGRRLILNIPHDWPILDITHGQAGRVLALLHLAEGRGAGVLLEIAHETAIRIASSREPSSGLWKVPGTIDHGMAGQTSYGYAHGGAGIATALLAAAAATVDTDLIAAAADVGDRLLTVAMDGPDATTVWPSGLNDHSGGLLHWCNGSSGVGSFLLRLYQATGEDRYRHAAERGGRAVSAYLLGNGPGYCHGLAGNGDYLLDLHAITGDPQTLKAANFAARLLAARHAPYHGRMLPLDETGRGFSPDFAGGLSGILAFLLRNRTGTSRMWMDNRTFLARVPDSVTQRHPVAAAQLSD